VTVRPSRLRIALGALAVCAAVACAPSKSSLSQRLWTEEFEFTITADQMPPHALDRIKYTVVVRDKKTHEPIVDGQGRIFGTNSDRKSIDDGFVYGPEVGVYHAQLTFITAGEWAMNVQFRRDATKALVRPDYDWRQVILPATSDSGTQP
jgi:hypothetical protein